MKQVRNKRQTDSTDILFYGYNNNDNITIITILSDDTLIIRCWAWEAYHNITKIEIFSTTEKQKTKTISNNNLSLK
jgi:hypothetical protein